MKAHHWVLLLIVIVVFMQQNANTQNQLNELTSGYYLGTILF